MPLYEYECNGCGHRFEILVYGKTRPVCPNCHGEDLSKAFSTFATAASGGASKGESCSMRTPAGGCGASGGG
ncbi:MAG: zinc ribbon domain-containing protein [Acidobacteria bacterium]|nr:zinc ribbon domain-containing protein [Acidobacteriota bacterium]